MPDIAENMLAWFGNGLTVAQEEHGETTEYLDDTDVPPVINHGPKPKYRAADIPVSTGPVNGVSNEKLDRAAESISTMPS